MAIRRCLARKPGNESLVTALIGLYKAECTVERVLENTTVVNLAAHMVGTMGTHCMRKILFKMPLVRF